MKCRKLIVAISLLMISVISIFAPRYLVRAESGINGNEAWVIAVVNGTFEYNGRYYRAYSGYIGQVCEYLNRDDVDLDESISLYEEGLKLSKTLKKQLQDFEKKIEALNKDDE